MVDYSGSPKVATLLIVDQKTQQVIEVPDWTIYGEGLEKLTSEERAIF
jgi:hypothetical protein